MKTSESSAQPPVARRLHLDAGPYLVDALDDDVLALLEPVGDHRPAARRCGRPATRRTSTLESAPTTSTKAPCLVALHRLLRHGQHALRRSGASSVTPHQRAVEQPAVGVGENRRAR